MTGRLAPGKPYPSPTVFVVCMLAALALTCAAYTQETEADKPATKGNAGGEKAGEAAGKDARQDGLGPPWTVAELKTGIKKGMFLKTMVVNDDTLLKRKTTTYMTQEYTAVSDEGYTVRICNLDEQGKETASESKDMKWEDGAKAPAATQTGENMVVSREKITVAAGEFECEVYAVTMKDDKGAVSLSLKFWYVKDKPGVMAKYESSMPGISTTTAELTEFKPGA